MKATTSQYKHNEIFPQVNSLPEQVFPSEARINRFVDYLNRYCKHWKKEYKEDIDDGIGSVLKGRENRIKSSTL